MPTAILSPSAKQQFFTDGSTVAAGYRLYTYLANTPTPAETYLNRAGTTPNQNPIILNARGEATIYLQPGVVYDYVLKTDQDVTVWTQEDVTADAGDADAVTFTQAGAGAVTRTSESKLRERISFEDYGAVGDGVADDTAAIQAAIDANPGKDIFATKLAYKISARLNILNAVRLHAPPGGAELRLATANTDHIMIGDGTLGGKNTSLGTEIDGFIFTVTVATNFTSGSCILVNYSSNLLIHDCLFYGKEGANTRLFRAITMLQCAQSTVRHCRSSFMRDSHFVTGGAPGAENRTVDVHFESCYLASSGNHAMWWSAHSAGMFASDCTILDVGNFDALRIESDQVTEQGTNFFINNINIEGGNYATGRGIAIIKGSVVQIANGWVGGIANPNPAVLVNALASDVEITGLRVDFSFMQVDAPSTSVKGCEIAGNNSTTAVGIVVSALAAGFLIAATRIKQCITSAIAIGGTPERGVISGVTMSNIGGTTITGANYTAGPSITGIRSNAPNAVATAATIVLDYGPDIYQVTGAAPNITDITPKAPGRRIQIQSGAGGITLATGSSIIPKGGAASVTVPAFRTIELVCDGFNWYETGGSY